jgi:ABC-type antimicrobial peptide transport system permease subunit
LAAGRVLEGLLWGLEPHDPLTLSIAALSFLGAAAVAAWLPARRAARVDPVRALNES